MLLKLVKKGCNIKFLLMATSLLTVLSSQPAFAGSCSYVNGGSPTKLFLPHLSKTISNSDSVRGWSYKGGNLASYVIFDGRQSVVVVENFDPTRGYFSNKVSFPISNSDSIRGWDWNPSTGKASYLVANSSGTEVVVEYFNKERGFGGIINKVKLSNSALPKTGTSWTWDGYTAQYTINGTLKSEYFNGSYFGGSPDTYRIERTVVGRSCL